MDTAVVKAISSIAEDAWTPIHYPNAIWDEGEQRLVSDAEVAEAPNTRIHLPQEVRTRPRPAHRAPRQTPQPGHRPARAGRAVHHLAPPRGVHRHHPGDAPGAGHPPRTRHHRTGPRRPARRPPGSPTLRIVRRQQCLAGPGRDRVQPHPRRRRDRIHVPRQGHHRHNPTTTHRGPGPAGPLRPTTILHLPKDWPWQDAWQAMFAATCRPPGPATT